MSDNEKDNYNNFEFIKEQVIVKKHKKVKKLLFQLFATICMAILFGVIATVTFIIAEPRLNKFLHKEEDTKTPVTFPTEAPDDIDPSEDGDKGAEITVTPSIEPLQEPTPEPDTVYETIAADLDDYNSMNEEIRAVAYEADKSILNVTSTFNVKDLFGNNVEKTVNTTGVIIYNNTKEFLILVSLDKVKDAKSIQIVFSDTMSADAVLQDYESELNLAIIAVELKDIPDIYMNSLHVATLGDSYLVSVGTPIIALGSPNGQPNSMVFGYVTSKGSWASITDNRLDLFNTSLENYKNGDGIIINLKGEVIGLITRTLKENENKDLNTAIGISKVKQIIANMGNETPRIYFGVKADDMTEATKKEHDITNGIYVNEVQANSPAYEAEMQNGDIILEIDDKMILNTNDFYNTISVYRPGDEITVKIKRAYGSAEKEMNLVVELTEKAK
jgi:serine protease Do